MLREADGSVKLVAVRPHTDEKPLEPDGESRVEPEEHKRSHNLLYWKKKLLTDICGPGGD